MQDLDSDGLADDYGTCLADDVTTTELDDSTLPDAGWMHVYVVTTENDHGEGSKGHTSSGLERPNASPCGP
jgi:hypothetical protein